MTTRDSKEKIRPCQPDPTEPKITVESLTFYKGLLVTNLDEKARTECLFETNCPVRFVDGGQKIYGAHFIARIIRVLVDVGLVSRTKYDDFQWKPTFNDLLGWLNQLVEKMKQTSQTAT